MSRLGLAAFAGFIATIFAANWLIQHVGIVDIMPGDAVLLAPAGVFAVGFAFTFRDVLQDELGIWWTVAAIVIGAALSYLVSPAFAAASAAAFLFSEAADLTVYTPLRRRTWAGGVALSNTVGAAVDSALFLWLAFGSLTFFWGQFVGKVAMIVPAILLLAVARAVLARNAQTGMA